MATYIVSYDLRKQRNYDALYEAIKSYGTWAHILESLWAIVSSRTTSEVRDHLAKFIDSDDGLFVIKSGKEAAWVGVTCNNEWLKQNL
jgi:hypothetical protein